METEMKALTEEVAKLKVSQDSSNLLPGPPLPRPLDPPLHRLLPLRHHAKELDRVQPVLQRLVLQAG